MIEIISEPINDRFYNLVADSKSRIRLCAPYVKSEIVNNIYSDKKANVKVDFISNFSMPNFYKRSSDIEAFKTITEQEDEVSNCQILHAKIYIFDDRYSIITSANLTPSGFNRNLEYGVFINDTSLVNKTVIDFKDICNNERTGRIDARKVIDIQNILKKLPLYREIESEPYNQNTEVDSILDIDINLIKANLNSWKKTTLTISWIVLVPYFLTNNNNFNVSFYNYLSLGGLISSIGVFVLCFLLMSNRHIKYIST
ncbi:type II deoxyribonuclease [Clostridium fermenticellae]|uniref:Type II deoxyribonuclease n=1 Tax=Clostridium fermenticellae TaxID=2068654 RepID=A0A386H5V1_9CLOT|nr:phospholipase D family protein [Clostridium fermenticellae]AYD40923.1 type II deoxyribonuclease [Clostridium fermenticellae]